MKKYKVKTFCDFGERDRKDSIYNHFSLGAAGRAYPRIWNIYHRIHGWRVWQEVVK